MISFCCFFNKRSELFAKLKGKQKSDKNELTCHSSVLACYAADGCGAHMPAIMGGKSMKERMQHKLCHILNQSMQLMI